MNEQSAIALMTIALIIGVTVLGTTSCSKVEDREKHRITSIILERELANQVTLKEKDLQLQCLKMKFKPSECGIK